MTSLSLFSLLPLLLGSPAQDVGLANLRVGHWVEVRGELDPQGVFVAQKVEVTEPDDDLLIGTAQAYPEDPEVFLMLGEPVHVSDKTEWDDGLDMESIVGRRIKLEGHYRDQFKFSARKVEDRGPGRERIGARIDAWRRTPKGWRAEIMHLEVFIPFDAEFEVDGKFDDLPLAPPRPPTLPGRTQEVDEDDFLGEGFQITDDLSVATQIQVRSLYEENYNLEFEDDEDRFDNSFSVRSRFIWTPHEKVNAQMELLHTHLWRNDDDDSAFSMPDLGLGETFVEWEDALGKDVDLIIGRQDFDERREWVYDQNLDGVRMVARRPRWQLELSATTTLGGDDSRLDRNAWNYIAYLSNGDKKRHLATYAMFRDVDVDFNPDNPDDLTGQFFHVGARAHGKWIDNNNSWFDVAFFLGESDGFTDPDIPSTAFTTDWAGYGFDVGTTWSPDRLEPFNFTVGYAFGSGDDEAGFDGSRSTYRQNGLADNTDRLAGVTSFRYYGELADPELANLAIFTLGVGMEVSDDVSLDLLWHQYTQAEASGFLFDTDLDGTPNGTDPDLGWELDLVYGQRWRNIDIEAVFGWFRPGDAFDAPVDDDALLAKLQIRYRL